MVIQEPVQAAVWHCLNHYAYSDAIFLAERLYAEVGSDDALFLLATSYYRSGKPARAHSLLATAGCPTAQCRYLLAQCCYEINKLSEAETALAGNIFQRNKSPDDVVNEFGEAASFALHLLAKVYSQTERTAKAQENYRRSLKLNPFMWSSYEALCQAGEKVDVSQVFQVTSSQTVSSMCASAYPPAPSQVTATTTTSSPTLASLTDHTNSNETPPQPPMTFIPSTPQVIGATPEGNESSNTSTAVCYSTTPKLEMAPPPSAPKRTSRKMAGPSRNLLATSAISPAATTPSPLTPSFGVMPLDLGPSLANCQNHAPFLTPSPVQSLGETTEHNLRAPIKKPMTRRTQQTSASSRPPVFNQWGNMMDRDVPFLSSAHQTSFTASNVSGPRRSSRLVSNASSSVKENNKNQGQRRFGTTKAPMKKAKSRLLTRTAHELNEINRAEDALPTATTTTTAASTQQQVVNLQRQSAEGLMQLLRELGSAYQALCQYECRRAVELFFELPPRHYNTGWVQCQVGRAYFEMSEYQKAEQVFSEVRQLAPDQLQGLEVYSTTLWHLQRDIQLSALAQQLTQFDPNAPEAWCAAGNCFSLQKEHDVAIKFFQRAVQVDPRFAYAYTLLGHEYVLTEELDRAIACFRNALRVNPRHYNAWYGVGMIYYKQEKFSLAEMHFCKALSINPNSSVLLCHVGVVQHALKKSEFALDTLHRAITADPKNPLCKFHRASILFAKDRHKEALKELDELKEIVPKESLVYFLIGKVHKKLGNTHLALMNFSWAMDLDPKGANNQIKEAVDKRYVTDDDEHAAEVGEASFLEDPLEGSSNASSLAGDDMQLQAAESDSSL